MKKEITSEFNYSRRKLPHWQEGGRTYFITFRSKRGILPDSALGKVKERILAGHPKFFDLHFAVVMPDHVHLLISPQKKSDTTWFELSYILKLLKGSSARSINKLLGTEGSVWQEESFDRMIRNEDELYEKWEYMWNNPVKAALSNFENEYKFYVLP